MQQFQTLKDRHRNTRAGMPEALNLRIHRALSWLQRAEQCEDADGRFVFLWIAFNAAYAQEIPHTERLSQQESFREFLRKLSDSLIEAVQRRCTDPSLPPRPAPRHDDVH